MAESINKDLADSLLAAIRGKGEDVRFPQAEIEADRIRQAKFCESSMREERSRQAKSIEAASKIYLTL